MIGDAWLVTNIKQINSPGWNKPSKFYLRRVAPFNQRKGEKKRCIKRNFLYSSYQIKIGSLLRETDCSNEFAVDFTPVEYIQICKNMPKKYAKLAKISHKKYKFSIFDYYVMLCKPLAQNYFISSFYYPWVSIAK